MIFGFFSDLYSDYLVYKEMRRMHRSYIREIGILKDNLNFVIAVIVILILIVIFYKFL